MRFGPQPLSVKHSTAHGTQVLRPLSHMGSQGAFVVKIICKVIDQTDDHTNIVIFIHNVIKT